MFGNENTYSYKTHLVECVLVFFVLFMVVGGKLFSYILMSHSVFSVLFIFMIHSDKRWTKPLEKITKDVINLLSV